MKKIYKYTLLLIAAFLFAPLAAIADDDPRDPTNTLTGLGFTKTVTQDPTKDNAYNITLTAFTTGSTISEEIDVSVAADIVLVLDVSGSMAQGAGSNVTSLELNRLYHFQNGNQSRYGIVFRQGNRYYLRYTTSNPDLNSIPTAYNLGTGWTGYNDVATMPVVPTGWTARLSRLELMKDAVKQFVRTVYSKNPTSGDKHKIAIVKFASATATNQYNGTQTIYNLTEVTSETQCDNIINNLRAGGGTQSQDGLQLAYNILNGVGNDGHSKVTVFFTDGVPGQNGWDGAEARGAVNTAYNLKGLTTTLKIDGEEVEDENGDPIVLESKVYAVGLLTSETSANTNDVRRFMHYVSSNYKFQITGNSYNFNTNHTSSQKLVNSGTTENPKYEYTGGNGGNEAYTEALLKYYQLSDGSDLTSIFQQIASSSSNAPTIPLQLKATDVVAVDVVSHSFKLPDGADASAIQVLVAPFTGIDEVTNNNPKTGKPYTEGEISRLEHYQFGTPMTYAAAKAAEKPVVPAYQTDGTTEIIPAATIDPNNRQKISVKGFNYADNWCGFDQHTINGVVQNIPHGYELVIVIPIEVDPANPGGATVDTNDPTSGIYITQEGQDEPIFAGFPQPIVTLPNIIIRKYGLLYEGEGASFLLEKLNDAGTAVDTSVAPYRIVVVATDNNPSTYDFVQVKLNEPGRYRVTETDWGWSYICTVGEIVPVGTATSAAGGMEEDDSFDPDNTLMETSTGTNAKGQPYIDRDVSGDTEQTITLPGGSNLSGAVYDFHNESKQHEHRNYSEAHKLNEFNTVFNPNSK